MIDPPGLLRSDELAVLVRADADVPGITEVFLGSLMSYVVLYRIINGVTCDVEEQDYINNTVDTFIRALEP